MLKFLMLNQFVHVLTTTLQGLSSVTYVQKTTVRKLGVFLTLKFISYLSEVRKYLNYAKLLKHLFFIFPRV